MKCIVHDILENYRMEEEMINWKFRISHGNDLKMMKSGLPNLAM